MRLLIGGSPCTRWSIAQTKNRETEPSGIGWELFLNFLFALEKYKPDYFLYENNKSMSKAIREEITRRFGFEPVCINSSKVSAQNRERLYWLGKREPDGTYSRVPVEQPEDLGILLRDILESGIVWKEKSFCLAANRGGHSLAHDIEKSKYDYVAEPVNMAADGKTYPVYEVRDGQITIKGKQYPIKLADGFYIIRKLTVTECKRLQTVPEWYLFPVSDSQAYKMLGNGWTVDVIVYLLGHIPGISTDPIEVLSMYDGMSCGHIALDKLGANVTRYYATEIDKYAIKTTQANFPETIQLGDAFQVRTDGWLERAVAT